MKLSNFVLFVIVIISIISFTKLNRWLNIKLWYIVVLFLLFFLLKFLEVHRENKKRNLLVNEIRGDIKYGKR
jgi:hypothetical protein